MNIGGEQYPVFNPYDKPTYEIHVSGCRRNCKGCHNKELQDFNYGEELNTHKIINKLKKRKKFFDTISIVGGDLLCQDFFESWNFIISLKSSFRNKEFWLFTGDEIHNVPKYAKEIFDYIKVGRYIEESKTKGFPSSLNQKLLKKGVDY